jgi:hypothetical protein
MTPTIHIPLPQQSFGKRPSLPGVSDQSPLLRPVSTFSTSSETSSSQSSSDATLVSDGGLATTSADKKWTQSSQAFRLNLFAKFAPPPVAGPSTKPRCVSDLLLNAPQYLPDPISHIVPRWQRWLDISIQNATTPQELHDNVKRMTHAILAESPNWEFTLQDLVKHLLWKATDPRTKHYKTTHKALALIAYEVLTSMETDSPQRAFYLNAMMGIIVGTFIGAWDLVSHKCSNHDRFVNLFSDETFIASASEWSTHRFLRQTFGGFRGGLNATWRVYRAFVEGPAPS